MEKVKYPRTMHLPFSPGVTSDDKIMQDMTCFVGHEIVCTEKFDGENTTMYADAFHARSLDGRQHPSRAWLARFHARIGYNIPVGWRVCGENMFAQHSVKYDSLDSYFLGFSVWDDNNRALSWDDTLEMFALLDITPVKELYRGKFDLKIIKDMSKNLDTNTTEGFVVRLVESFDYKDFGSSVAKWVRKNHVATDKHWMHSEIIPNGLRHE